MEALIPILLFAFIGYQWSKKAKQFMAENRVVGEKKIHDPQKLIQMVLKGDSQPLTQIRPRQQLASDRDGELFKEDKWRRQLFLTSLLLGVGYLVYLYVI